MFSVYPSHTHTFPLSDGSEDSLINARCQSRGAQTDRFFDLLEQTYAKNSPRQEEARTRVKWQGNMGKKDMPLIGFCCGS